jgi:hypothetical protein
MMGGGAFTPLKTGRAGPKSAKQVEIGLAILLKILCIARPRRLKSPRRSRKDVQRCDVWQFAHGSANGPEWLDLLSGTRFLRRI